MRVSLAFVVTTRSGVSATSCSGVTRVTAKLRRKTLRRGKAKLRFRRGACRASLRLKLKRRKVAGKRIRLTVAFAGNSTLGRFTARRTVRIRRR